VRLLLAAAVLLVAAPLALANASHIGWPKHFHKTVRNASDSNRTIHGSSESDELLGGHGDDTILAGAGDDVIWGDYKPCCQPSGQHDVLDGGDGNDFIYTSHAHDKVTGGAGDDVIHALYGRGTIDCGPGRDAVYVPRPRSHYKYRHCEYKRHKTGESAPAWWLRKH
jgi:hypothetical protein